MSILPPLGLIQYKLRQPDNGSRRYTMVATHGTPTILELVWMIINPWSDGDTRQYAWHKQKLYKKRNIIYGTGWAGWGFESNVTAAAANAASDAVLRAAPIFEHDPASMFSGAISTNDINDILIKGIPALSWPVGRNAIRLGYGDVVNIDMNLNNANNILRPNGWPWGGSTYQDRWLHSQLIYVAHLYAHKLFEKVIDLGGLK